MGANLHIDVLCRFLLLNRDDELHLRVVVLVKLTIGWPLSNHLDQWLLLLLLLGGGHGEGHLYLGSFLRCLWCQFYILQFSGLFLLGTLPNFLFYFFEFYLVVLWLNHPGRRDYWGATLAWLILAFYQLQGVFMNQEFVLNVALEFLHQIVQNLLKLLRWLLHFLHDARVDMSIISKDFTWGRFPLDWLRESYRYYLPSGVIFWVREITFLVQWWQNSVMVNDVQVEFVRV